MSASAQGAAAGLAQNGIYWKVIAYSVVVGGNVLAVGSMAGLSLQKIEHMHVGWFLRNVGWKALLGGIAGLGALYAIDWCYAAYI